MLRLFAFYYIKNTLAIKFSGIHIFSIDSYVILYLPNKKAKRVIIVRILYGARDIQIELTNINS